MARPLLGVPYWRILFVYLIVVGFQAVAGDFPNWQTVRVGQAGNQSLLSAIENVQGSRGQSWPQIFIYDLPDDPFRTCDRLYYFNATSNYAAEIAIPEAISRSAHLTTDPDEADFFLVHAYLYCARPSIVPNGSAPVLWNRLAIDMTLSHIISKFPYWNRTDGRDHLWIVTQDHGPCGFQAAESMSAAVKNSIILTHWGLMDSEAGCQLNVDFYAYGCWHRRSRFWKQEHLPCFVPGKDTVIPSNAGEFDNWRTPFVDQISAVKRYRFFFSGGARFDDVSYSHGVRQTLMLLFNNTPGFKLVATDGTAGDREYLLDFGRSLFCLACSGAGWGVRLKLALMHGCIPVVIADGIQMPYEDVLPYPDFAVRLRQHALYRLPEVLETIVRTKGMVERMQRNVQCVWRYFVWRGPEARAFEALICSLRRKLTAGKLIPRMDWDSCLLSCEAA